MKTKLPAERLRVLVGETAKGHWPFLEASGCLTVLVQQLKVFVTPVLPHAPVDQRLYLFFFTFKKLYELSFPVEQDAGYPGPLIPDA